MLHLEMNKFIFVVWFLVIFSIYEHFSDSLTQTTMQRKQAYGCWNFDSQSYVFVHSRIGGPIAVDTFRCICTWTHLARCIYAGYCTGFLAAQPCGMCFAQICLVCYALIPFVQLTLCVLFQSVLLDFFWYYSHSNCLL